MRFSVITGSVVLGLASSIINPALAHAKQSGRAVIQLHKQVSVAFEGMHQHYRERKNGSMFDRENGWLYGSKLSASYMTTSNHYLIGGAFQYALGHIHYQSQTMTSSNSNRILRAHIRVGKGFLVNDNLLVTPFATYGHRYWHRKLSYVENYNMNYAGAGLIVDYQIAPRWIVSARAMGASTFHNTLNTPNNSLTYKLPDKPLVQVSLKADYRLTPHTAVFISTQYTHFQFGKSNYHPSNNTFEPRSTTRNVSVRIGWRYQIGA